MKIVIIGNGIAGQIVAQNIRKKGKDFEIVMISRENHPYYSRIFLPHFISGDRTKKQLYQRDLDWYDKNKIQLLLNTEVAKINPQKKYIELLNSEMKITYDNLVLAVGSEPRKMSFGNPDVQGVFTLRTLSDADEIASYIKSHEVKKAFIIGGGLLGIELGYHVKNLNIEVTICEIFPYLLPRQLDQKTSGLLKKYLEKIGLKFVLGETVEKIVGSQTVEGIKMKSGQTVESQIIMEQLGIIPNTELAKISGLETDKGIIVNEFMQTNDPKIYAVGDCIQFDKQIWGIIPASMEQAKLAAAHILNEDPKPYTPSVWHTKLKVAGIDLTCVGSPSPKDEKDAQILTNIHPESYMCRKVIIEENKLTGAILMGLGGDSRYFINNVGKDVDIEQVKEKINE
jgi:nitrite reductase (NADH) large subunit